MKDLEAIVHPLVVSEREKVLAALPEDSRQLVVCDIPLLYETKGNNQVLGHLNFQPSVQHAVMLTTLSCR